MFVYLISRISILWMLSFFFFLLQTTQLSLPSYTTKGEVAWLYYNWKIPHINTSNSTRWVIWLLSVLMLTTACSCLMLYLLQSCLCTVQSTVPNIIDPPYTFIIIIHNFAYFNTMVCPKFCLSSTKTPLPLPYLRKAKGSFFKPLTLTFFLSLRGEFNLNLT